MTRPRKQTVDYFPHQCHHGETMFILEQRYGNDGYAFWFKLLELLGKTEGHLLDCTKPTTLNYLAAKTLIDNNKVLEILNLLSELEAIDTELWCNQRIVWSENFIKGLSFAYRNRDISIPDKPVIQCKKSGISGVSDVRNPQMKVNEMKGKKNIYMPLPPDFDISPDVKAWAEKKGFDRLEEHLEAFKDLAIAKSYKYADWDAAFRKAVRQDYARLRTDAFGKPKEEMPEWTKKFSTK